MHFVIFNASDTTIASLGAAHIFIDRGGISQWDRGLLYDATAPGSNYAVNNQDFYYNVVKEFEAPGWRVKSEYLGIENHRR